MGHSTYEEYTRFMKIRAEFVKKRWRKGLRDNAGDDVFVNIEDFGHAFNDLMIRLQTMLSKPIVNLGSTVNKWVFAASVLSRMGWRILFVTVLFMSLTGLLHLLVGEPVSFITAFGQVIQNKFFQVFLVAALLFNMRLIVFRLRDRDVSTNGSI